MTAPLSKEAAALVESFEALMASLLERTACSRTTLRLDLPEIGATVTLPVAEALTPGARSLRQEGSVNQRAAATAQWVEKHRRILVQNDFETEPRPPQALLDVYGVQAQMLGPIVLDGDLAGWVSIHEIGRERVWRESDIAALQETLDKLVGLIEAFQGA